MLCNVVLVSAVQQHKSVIYIYIYIYIYTHPLPLEPPVPLPERCQTGLFVLYSSFPLAIYFTHDIAHMSMLLHQFVQFSPPLAVSTNLLLISVLLEIF